MAEAGGSFNGLYSRVYFRNRQEICGAKMWEAISWDVSIQCGTVFLQRLPPKKSLFGVAVRFLVVPAVSKIPIRGLCQQQSARWFVLRLFCLDAQARYLHRQPIAESPMWTAVADTPATMKPNPDFNHQVS